MRHRLQLGGPIGSSLAARRLQCRWAARAERTGGLPFQPLAAEILGTSYLYLVVPSCKARCWRRVVLESSWAQPSVAFNAFSVEALGHPGACKAQGERRLHGLLCD